MQNEKTSLQEKFIQLAKMKFNSDNMARIISKIYDDKENTRAKNNMDRIAQIIGDNASKIPPGQKGTGYDLFNGITYFTTHESTIKKNTSRLESTMFGTAQKFSEHALNIILAEKPDSMINDKFTRSLTIN